MKYSIAPTIKVDPKTWRNTLTNPEFKKNLNREAPVFANINMLGTCNVDCYFCLGKDINDQFKQHNQVKTHFSEWKNFDEFLRKCAVANIKRIYLTGQNTDALVYRYVKDLVPYVQSRGFDMGLRTNGYLAPRNYPVIQECRRSVGYSIHSLNPETNWKIMRRRDIPDWETIIPNTPQCRISIVLNRYNEFEFPALLKFAAGFSNVKYIQVRRICTDTREDYLGPDVEVYERVFDYVKARNPVIGHFYSAEVFKMFGKEVCFWRTVKTTIDSFNYYTDGTINDEYFVIEGYMRDAKQFPRVNGIPVKPKGLEGYWNPRE
jgi:MoaA/NifB/PqqE/SkfB family radical SAM enzyme